MARERLEKEFHRFYLPGGEKRIGGDREGYFNAPIIILSYYRTVCITITALVTIAITLCILLQIQKKKEKVAGEYFDSSSRCC